MGSKCLHLRWIEVRDRLSPCVFLPYLPTLCENPVLLLYQCPSVPIWQRFTHCLTYLCPRLGLLENSFSHMFTPQVFFDMEASKYQHAEMRISIYGRKVCLSNLVLMLFYMSKGIVP